MAIPAAVGERVHDALCAPTSETSGLPSGFRPHWCSVGWSVVGLRRAALPVSGERWGCWRQMTDFKRLPTMTRPRCFTIRVTDGRQARAAHGGRRGRDEPRNGGGCGRLEATPKIFEAVPHGFPPQRQSLGLAVDEDLSPPPTRKWLPHLRPSRSLTSAEITKSVAALHASCSFSMAFDTRRPRHLMRLGVVGSIRREDGGR